jgi:hypothetical protein
MEEPIISSERDPYEPKSPLDLRKWLDRGLSRKVEDLEDRLGADTISQEEKSEKLQGISNFLKGQETEYNPTLFSGQLFVDSTAGLVPTTKKIDQRLFYSGPTVATIDHKRQVLLSFFQCSHGEGNQQQKTIYYAKPNSEDIERMDILFLGGEIKKFGEISAQRIDNNDFYDCTHAQQDRAIQKNLQIYEQTINMPQDIYEITPARYMLMAPGQFEYTIRDSEFDQSQYPENERLTIKGRYVRCKNADYLAKLQETPGELAPFKEIEGLPLSQAQPCLLFEGLDEQSEITFIVPAGSIGKIRLSQEVVS